MRWLRMLFAGVLFACRIGPAVGQSGNGYDLSWTTIDGGGATSSESGYELQGSIGQPDAGALAGGGFELVGGFWSVSTGTSMCIGDCDGNGQVAIDEILTLVSIALGTLQTSACTAGDVYDDAQVTVDEIVAAVNRALSGCRG